MGKSLYMYRPDIKRKKSGAPILSRKEIDIDLFVQDYLGMEQDFQYLSHCGIYLGMTVFNDTDKIPVYNPADNCAEYISARAHTVIIDNTLLEKNQEHRYRFTMGHEASHGFLHKEYFAYDPNQITLFDFMGQAPVPMVQCRIDTKKLDMGQIKTWTDRDWMEWQANALSSAILMPESMVRLIAESFGNLNLPKRLLCYAMIEKVASVFNVSLEAVGYRLKQLG